MKSILLSSIFTILLSRAWGQYPNAFLPNSIGSPAYPGTLAPFANTIAAASPVISNIQVTPTLSEIVPSLQFGDISMAGDMPIGGTIKVRGCFPVYGIVGIDGIVPSLGTAIVTEVIGNQVLDVVNKCANQLLS